MKRFLHALLAVAIIGIAGVARAAPAVLTWGLDKAVTPANVCLYYNSPSCFTIGTMTAGGAFAGAFTTLSVSGAATFSDRFRSLQSFGAVGDGVADDTAAVQTALNSGIPLQCRGTFKLTSLVTITNVNVYVHGGGGTCKLVYDNANTMIYANMVGGSAYTTVRVFMENVILSINAAITSVAGPAQTAALYITYSADTNGVTLPTVILKDVQVKPTAVGNYIKHGIYLDDASKVWIENYLYEGRRSTFQADTRAIVFDGNNSPTNLHVLNSIAFFAGFGIFAPEQATLGWQGIRITGFDCTYCEAAIRLLGALDGKSDFVDITQSQGAFEANGIFVRNVINANIHDNYMFMADMPITGGTQFAFPVCFSSVWTIAIPNNGANNNIEGNTCDGAQVTGYTTRFGVEIQGVSDSNMSSHLGVNRLSRMDIALTTKANTAGWLLEKQLSKLITTEWQNTSSAGAHQLVPPLAVTDGSNAAAGTVGEVITSRCPDSATTATVTITIASPGVITWTAHGFTTACPVAFTTTGALPTGIVAGTTYWIVPSSVTTNTFQIAINVSNALAGTSINTSGSQSGTHTGTAGSALVTATVKNVTGVSLTAGDWECGGGVDFDPAGTTTITALIGAVNTTAVLPAKPQDGAYQELRATFTTGAAQSLGFGTRRFLLSATTTQLLVAQSSFGTSTMTAAGIIKCRRMR